MYTVIESFTDLQDGNYVYISGEPYPRKGYTPSDERIAELAGSNNKLKRPLIVKTDETPEETDDKVLEVPVDVKPEPKTTGTPEEATEEAKGATPDTETGENSPKAPEAKKTPKKARGKVSEKE